MADKPAALETFLEQNQVVVHLGAHKTATTYFQSALKAQRRALRAAGTAVILPSDLRQTRVLRRSDPQTTGRRRKGDTGLPRPDLAHLLDVAASAPDTTRIILSEEGLIGSARNNLARRVLYPDLENRLTRLPAVLDHPNVTVLFALRDYGSFISSNVTTAVRRGNRFDLDVLRAGFLTMARRWPDVVVELHGRFPRARLRLWRYEDFSELEAQVFASFADGMQPVSDKRRFQTLSQDAMAQILVEIGETGTTAKRAKAIVRAAIAAHPITGDNPRYNLWAEDHAAALTELYDADWQRIRDRFPESVLA